MNPSSKEAPKFNMPQSANEQLPPASAAGQETAGKKPERAAAAPERASSPPAAVPVAGAAAVPVPIPPNSAQVDDNSTTKPTKKPLLEDTDLIEKEWVNKAKHIVENTKNDPHRQSEELTGVKVDYMKQHYGKTIKLK